MSGKGRHAATATMAAPPCNQRIAHLSELHAAVQTHPELDSGLLERRGATWVSIVRYAGPRRTVEIGCDFRAGAWWFCRPNGQPIAPATDITGTLDKVTDKLRAVARRPSLL